ncbi:MAG TPA: hypothetical protein VM286_01375 [Candidatus Thermoplasmatota archaeon]|nr:hypothetical protein [Candidatus Thermoplasmatota archaeon]
MGQSVPTVTHMLDRFQSRYGGFRAGLPRSEQALFDRLVAEGHRHTNALNSHPEMDFERPLFLAMLLATIDRLEREQATLQRGIHGLERRLGEVSDGVPAGRLPPPDAQQPGGVGQARLGDVEDGGPVPA